MSSFIIPRVIHHGHGVIAELAALKGKKATVVIGGSSIKSNGGYDRILSNLKKAGFEVQVIDGVEADPGTDTVMAGAKKMLEFQPDLIVAVGGGSPIDGAKAMWIFYEYPDLTFEKAAVPFTLPELRQKARFVAIPTTSGTATEVTSFAVITDSATGIKYPIADYNLTPDMAIVDLDLVASMPPSLVANTGMDALTHALEAYVSTVSTDITDALAMKAIEMIHEYLIPSFQGDEKGRDKMHVAQCLAGMSFSNAILGIVHSMAHKSGAILKIPHGCANAIYLPHVIAFNAQNAAEKYATVADRIGLSGSTSEEKTAALASYIKDLSKRLGIPATLRELGVPETLFKDSLDAMADTAVTDPCTGTNPRAVNGAEMRELFMAAYYG